MENVRLEIGGCSEHCQFAGNFNCERSGHHTDGFLLVMRRQNVQKRYYRGKLFGIMTWLTIMGCTVESLSFLIDNRVFVGCIPLSYLLNSLCFLGTSCVGFLWCIYVELRIFNSLKKVRVAMDDYGTGSASSSIVMNIPMDEIKIDMSFIRDIMDNPKNQAMVLSILEFARKSNIATCLEGVENEKLQNYLRDYNATWFQGYYYGKPFSARSLENMVSSQLGK